MIAEKEKIIDVPKMKSHLMNILDFWVFAKSTVGGWLVSFIMPVSQFLLFTIVLTLCDVFTGIRAAQSRREKITSYGLRRWFDKIILYMIAILLAEGMVFIFKLPLNLSYVVTFAIAITEFKSNVENIEQVTNTGIWSYVKSKFKI